MQTAVALVDASFHWNRIGVQSGLNRNWTVEPSLLTYCWIWSAFYSSSCGELAVFPHVNWTTGSTWYGMVRRRSKKSIHPYIHTYRHTYVRTYTHTHIHIHTHTYTRTYTHIHTYMYIYTYIHSYLHTIHTYIPAHLHIYMADFCSWGMKPGLARSGHKFSMKPGYKTRVWNRGMKPGMKPGYETKV